MKYSLMDYLKWGGGAVLALCAIVAIIWLVVLLNKEKKKSTEWRKRYYACQNAPADTTIQYANFVVHPPVNTKWKPKKPVVQYETVPNLAAAEDTTGDAICEEWTKGVYDYKKDSLIGRIFWQTYSRNCKTIQMDFPQIDLPERIVTITKQHDTCQYKEPEYKPRNQWWLYGKPQGVIYPFNVSGVSLGVIYTVQDAYGGGVGVGYDWIHGSPMFEVTALFNLRLKRNKK